MKNSDSLEKELRLRKLFIKLVRNKCNRDDIFYPEPSWFFDGYAKFSLDKIKTFWEDYIGRIKHRDNCVSLILSIPFCRSRCEYCSHYRWADRQKSDVDDYIRLLIREMRFFKDVFKDIKFKVFQVMGGSPSRLTEKQLKVLLAEVHKNFMIEKQAVQCFDFNPHDSSREKMKILLDFGINQISFGVQSLDPQVLRAANRGYQDYDTIKGAVHDVREFPGLERINVELLIGLRNDTPHTVLETFIKLAKLRIDSIRVYQLSPLPSYVKKYYNNSRVLFDQELAEKRRNFKRLVAPVAEELGYHFIPEDYPDQESISFDFLLKNHDPSIRRKYNFKRGKLPIDCLGIGVDSCSRISNIIYYENDGFLPSCNEKDDLEVLYRGVLLSDQRDRFSYIMTALEKDEGLSMSGYKNVFGTDIYHDFKKSLDKLKRLGAITINKNFVSLTPKTRGEEFAYLLFFLDNPTVLSGLDKLNAKRSELLSQSKKI